MTTTAAGLDGTTLRYAYSMFPTGVVAVCGQDEDADLIGMAMSSFNSVSLSPALVSLSAAKDSTTWPRLAALPRLGLSVLAEDQADVCGRLSAKTGDRFAGVPWLRGSESAVLIEGAALWMECSIHGIFEAGDHVVVLLEVHEATPADDVTPLVFHRSRLTSVANRPV